MEYRAVIKFLTQELQMSNHFKQCLDGFYGDF